MQIARIAVIVLIVVLVLAFIIDNAGTVEFSFVFFRADISLIVLLLLTFVAGVVVGIAGARFLAGRIRRPR